MSNIIARKVLASVFAATTLLMSGTTLLATSSPAQAQARSSYGGVTFLGPAYTFQSHNGQMGNVTFFGAPPTTYPSHNGQMGNVTYLGGAKPYTYPGHSGQVGNVTYLNARPAGTVPIRTIPTPHIVPVRTSGHR